MASSCPVRLFLQSCAAVLDQFKKLACFEVELPHFPALFFKIDVVVLHPLLELADREGL